MTSPAHNHILRTSYLGMKREYNRLQQRRRKGLYVKPGSIQLLTRIMRDMRIIINHGGKQIFA